MFTGQAGGRADPCGFLDIIRQAGRQGVKVLKGQAGGRQGIQVLARLTVRMRGIHAVTGQVTDRQDAWDY